MQTVEKMTVTKRLHLESVHDVPASFSFFPRILAPTGRAMPHGAKCHRRDAATTRDTSQNDGNANPKLKARPQ
jgi:hypothetical protein